MIFLDIAVKSKKWEKEPKIVDFIKKTCKKLILSTEIGKISKNLELIELSISLVSDAQIKKINFNYRGKNKPTNTLSFPALDGNLIQKKGLKEAIKGYKSLILGDILLSYETIQKESLAQKKEMCHHITHLILHSLLHLIGFDHKNEKDAKIMEDLEIEILKKLKIKNPYLPY